MNPDTDDYLWDGGGAVDPEVARLEALLGGLGHRGAPPPLPRRSRAPLAIIGGLVAIAAAVALWLATRANTSAPCGGDAGFRFAAIAGTARCGDTALAAGTLPVGGWLETSRDGTAALTIADIGEVRIGADSRVGLIATGPDQHRLSLVRGSLHAVVTAPPRLFVVDTPAATAVDLGCEYDLAVDPDGGGTLSVRRGTVELAARDRVAVVPAGTVARTRTAHGPGTPARRDA
ncbi:MAG: FecR family protein, partial [Deltaproteobacteria bacterium]|nr:FecR family protein [Deltaproteobacteria bacterium]